METSCSNCSSLWSEVDLAAPVRSAACRVGFTPPPLVWGKSRIPAPTSSAAAAGTSQAASPQRCRKEGTRECDARGSRISFSCRRMISREFQTRGLGSSRGLQVMRFMDDALQAGHQSGAVGARLQMRLQLRVAAVFHEIGQLMLKLFALHDFSLPKSFRTAFAGFPAAIRPFRLCSF